MNSAVATSNNRDTQMPKHRCIDAGSKLFQIAVNSFGVEGGEEGDSGSELVTEMF